MILIYEHDNDEEKLCLSGIDKFKSFGFLNDAEDCVYSFMDVENLMVKIWKTESNELKFNAFSI